MEVPDALQHFLGIVRPMTINPDNADNLSEVEKDSGFGEKHEFSQPGMHQTNGVAELAAQDGRLWCMRGYWAIPGVVPLPAIVC